MYGHDEHVEALSSLGGIYLTVTTEDSVKKKKKKKYKICVADLALCG